MKRIFLGAIMALVAVSAGSAYAAELLVPQKGSGNVVISASETRRNLYTAGGSVTMQGTIEGDLFAAGGSVTVSGNVSDDLFAAGGNISISGNVGGDMRVGGGNISITGPVGGDLLLGGGSVTVTSEQGIGGEAWISGGSVILNAPVRGDLRIAGGEVLINAPVTGSVEITAEKLVFGSSADVQGEIVYRGANEPIIEDGAVVGAIDFQERVSGGSTQARARTLLTIGFLIHLLAILSTAIVLFLFFRVQLLSGVQKAYTSPWKSLGIGLVGIIVWPIATILLFVTVIGYHLALVSLALFLLTILGSAVLGSVFVGSLLVKWIGRGSRIDLTWLSIVVGVMTMSVIGLVPFVGWVIGALVCLISFGTLLRLAHRFAARKFEEQKAARQQELF